MRRMDQHDAKNRAVEADLVEHAGDVDVDRKIGYRLWQQERKEDQRSPTQSETGERVARGNRDDQAHEHRQQCDPDARAERRERIAAGREHPRPESEAEFLRQFAREVPLLCECPEKQIGERPEDDEREQRQQKRDAEHSRQGRRCAGVHGPPCGAHMDPHACGFAAALPPEGE